MTQGRLRGAGPPLHGNRRTGEQSMKNLFIRIWRETEGQDLVEYALIVAAIALALIVAVKGIATALSSMYDSIAAALTSV
jgi:Flp pilus assembly pilin Flp